MVGVSAILALAVATIFYGVIAQNSLMLIQWGLAIGFAMVVVLAGLIYYKIRQLPVYTGQTTGRGQVGRGRLRYKLIIVFVLITIPSLILSSFSWYMMDLGIKIWFAKPVNDAIENAYYIAQAYHDEHIKNIESDALTIARSIDNALIANPNDKTENLAWILQINASVRGIQEGFIFTPSRVLARYGLSYSMEFDPLEYSNMQNARKGEVVLIKKQSDRIRALVALSTIADGFLMIERQVDPKVISQLEKTQESYTNYNAVELKRFDIQLSLTQAILLITLIIFLILLSFSYWIAGKIAVRIEQLSQATNRVSGGDLSVQLPLDNERDEVSTLTQNFNAMLTQINQQHQRILASNAENASIRQYQATALEGLSQGVMSITNEGLVQLINQSARELLAIKGDIKGEPIANIIKDLPPLMDKARQNNGEFAAITAPHRQKIVQFRVGYLGPEFGYIATIDDLTALISAERQAAWSDVARRIAHEVKNPLTPIQLSAERLRRKYKDIIPADDGVFNQCIDTIIRQVGDIGRLIDEFSKFARMPSAQKAPINIISILNEVVFLEQSRPHRAKIQTSGLQNDSLIDGDKSLLAQAFSNIIKNGLEAIDEKHPHDNGLLHIAYLPDQKQIIFTDNGPGFSDNPNRLFEPYMTTKTTGTGLGLAITKKIFDEHGFKITLKNNTDNDGQILGAMVIIALM